MRLETTSSLYSDSPLYPDPAHRNPKRKRSFWKKLLLLPILLGILLGVLCLCFRPVVRYVFHAYVLPRLEKQWNLKIQVGSMQVETASLVLKQVRVEDRLSTILPPTTFGEVKVTWNLLHLFQGSLPIKEVLINGSHIELSLASFTSGKEAVIQLLKRIQNKDSASKEQNSWKRYIQGPPKIQFAEIQVLVKHPLGNFRIQSVEGVFQKGQTGEVIIHEVSLPLPTSIVATCQKATFTFPLKPNTFFPSDFPSIAVENGAVAPWKKLSLTGIRGTVQLDVHKPGYVTIALTGGYGGVDKELWEAKGGMQLDPKEADIELHAKRFKLSALQPILKADPALNAATESSSFTLHGTTFLNSEHTDIGAQLKLHYRKGILSFDGALQVNNLSFFLPRLAASPLRKINIDTQVHGRLEKGKKLILENSSFRSQGAQINIELIAEAQPYGLTWPGGEPFVPKNLRERFRNVEIHVQIPPIPCQTLLNAIPKPLIPKLDGLKLKGNYSADLRLKANFTKLLHLPEPPISLEIPEENIATSLRRNPTSAKEGSKTKNQPGAEDAVLLSGKMPGLDSCQVIKSPLALDSKRLQNGFNHLVEQSPGNFKPLFIGPKNPYYVSYEEISPHLIKSIMTTEDHGFMFHHGFIISEFRTALEQNLKYGAFRFGASSITMQMIKNVLLSREKTLGRKLQELILTWYLDYKRNLSKKRILEIYFNAIEFGPGIYGIGRATQHYFGKTPKELTPKEAAWFSSILPNPKSRHAFYCYGAPSEKWDSYLNRIVRKNHERGRITDEEYEQAIEEKLVFDRTDFTSESKCLALGALFRRSAQSTQSLSKEELEKESEDDSEGNLDN